MSRESFHFMHTPDFYESTFISQPDGHSRIPLEVCKELWENLIIFIELQGRRFFITQTLPSLLHQKLGRCSKCNQTMQPPSVISCCGPLGWNGLCHFARKDQSLQSTPAFPPFVRRVVSMQSNIPCLNQLFQLWFIQLGELALECFTSIQQLQTISNCCLGLLSKTRCNPRWVSQ